jgi:anti-sigma regulatory factor (Ser/Thr protein kinase)
VGLALIEGGGRRLSFTASDRDAAAAPVWCHVDAYDDVPLNSVIRTGRPVLGTLDTLHQRYPGFVERQRGTGTVALAAVPIVAAGQTLGGYVLFFDEAQRLHTEQQRELEELGRELGLELRRAQRSDHRAASDYREEEVPPGAAAAVFDVGPDPAAVGSARRFLRGTLSDWGVDEESTDTAVLCLSELVTNALIHTEAGCSVRIVLDRDVLTTSVRDLGNRDAMAVEPLVDPLQVHGRGLQIVDALATRWGSTLDRGGTTVWFVLDLE